MPATIIGMIGVSPSHGASVHINVGGISRDYVRDFARAHEESGYDQVLVAYLSKSAEAFSVAQYAAAHTETLRYMVAHRPGLMSPSLAARLIATADVFTGGRLALHIIAGVSDAEQQSEGDFLQKDDRYRRAAEYLDLLQRIWTEHEPVSYEGEFYRLVNATSDVRPMQSPYPPIYFGGSSTAALDMGARYCDIYAIFAEPLAETAQRVRAFRQLAAKFGRAARFNLSVRPIIAATEGAAWDKAGAMLRDVESAPGKTDGARSSIMDRSTERLNAFAATADVHDERLWFGITKASGSSGNTSCLVGTPEQVADALMKYYRLGIDSFLIRGFDPFADTVEFGRELIPRIRAAAAEIDRAAAAQ